jgi:hypothetical protein
MQFLENGREEDIRAFETFHRTVEQRASGLGVEYERESFLIGFSYFSLTFEDVSCHSDT